MQSCNRALPLRCLLTIRGSLSQRVFSGPGGIDPYSSAVSDVYQDLFQEGSYTGKGIYDIDAFEAALAGKVPENALLSHDLFEGIFARVALATDIELFEEFPSRYEAVAARQHRWARGDWQLLPWLFGRGHSGPEKRNPVRIPTIGRWKILDNLRRTLSAPAAFLTLVVGWASALCFSLGMDAIHSRDRCDSCTPAIFHRTHPASKRYFPAKPFSRRAQRPGARRMSDWLGVYIFGISDVADDGRDSADPRPPVYHAQELA